MAASSMMSYFRRNNFMKSRHLLVWSQSSHLKDWRRNHLAASTFCNNIRYLSTSQKLNIETYPESKQHEREQPIAYSKSPAQNHKVDNTLQYDPGKLSSIRVLVICIGLFSTLIYFGFIRNETESEKKIFDWKQLSESPEDNQMADLEKK